MEELFRFSQARAVQRSQRPGLSLARGTAFQQSAHEECAAALARFHRAGDEGGGQEFEAWAMLARHCLDRLTSDAATWIPVFGASAATNTSRLGDQIHTLREAAGALLAIPPSGAARDWRGIITTARAAVGTDEAAQLLDELSDLFIALLVVRAAGPTAVDRLVRRDRLSAAVADFLQERPSLEEVADLLRMADLLSIPDAASAALTEAEVEAALEATLVLPEGLFALREKPVHPVGILDLLVVKQHILRYDGAEISRVENVLKGESRGRNRKHTLSTENQRYWESEQASETDEELTTSDHVEMRQEVEKTLKEDTKLDAGVHVQYGGASFKVQADLTTAYDKATSESVKSATEVARDITQKAAKKVTSRVTQRQVTTTVETFEDSEEQSFLNAKGNGHVIGVYQWLEKVYLAQVFNYGRHVIFDLMVPEPAASFRKQIERMQQQVEAPQMPPDLPVTTPTDISAEPGSVHFYGKLVGSLKATGVEPPPATSITVAASKVFPYEDNTVKSGQDTLRIDDGYAAVSVRATATWVSNDDDEGGVGPWPDNGYIDLKVGSANLRFTWPAAIKTSDRNATETLTENLNPVHPGQPVDVRAITYSFATNLVNALNLALEITCVRSPEVLAKWQLQTYDKLLARWQRLQDDYQAALELWKQREQDVVAFQWSDEASNRLLERTELKRECIALLDNSYTYSRGIQATDDWGEGVDPDLALVQAGTWVRWFEQAFEWDKIGYVFYPYFWADSDRWPNLLGARTDDVLTKRFLQAGYARVTVPVRNGFEDAVTFYLMTGIPWLGGGLPSVGAAGVNPLYLSLVDELKESSGAPGNEQPAGDPWEIHLPTTLIKLRKELDGTTPTWSRAVGASDAPVTPWTWTPDEPPR